MTDDKEDLEQWVQSERARKQKIYNLGRIGRKKCKSRITISNSISSIEEPDWEQLILELRSVGIPSSFVSEAVGNCPGTLATWLCNRNKTNRRMGWKMGTAILRLHKEFYEGKKNGPGS